MLIYCIGREWFLNILGCVIVGRVGFYILFFIWVCFIRLVLFKGLIGDKLCIRYVINVEVFV